MRSTRELSSEDFPRLPRSAQERSLEFAPGVRFSGRYLIVEKAGAGGMGVVYKALDTVLDLPVALKLIRPELARLPRFVERFKNEVRLTRRIAHPNVCRVHDLGESGGILYLSMEWVDGETLRQLLHQAGALTEDRALEIAERIAGALEAAHAQGIVHRDLKPDNVMIDGRGEVHVMDFGLALEPSLPDADPGGAVGTPAYMAPEQSRGEEVDARADLYALGLILYEMLTGSRCGPARPAAPTGPTGSGRSLRSVVATLLAERREERYASAQAAGQAIHLARRTTHRSNEQPVEPGGRSTTRRLVWGLGGAAALVVAGLFFAHAYLPSLRHGRQPGQLGQEQFDPARVYYDRGLHYLRQQAETMRGLDDAIQMFHRALGKNRGLAVAWAYLGEAYWTRFQRTREASSREQAVQAVEEALRLNPGLPEALNARGVGLIIEGRFAEARALLEEVVRAKPDFDIAWANLGEALQQMEDYSAGLEALQTAIRLQPGRSRHHLMLGLFYDHFAEHDAAVRAYEKALEMAPDSIMGLNNLGSTLLVLGRYDEAAGAFQRSLGLEERAAPRANLGTARFFQGKYEEAVENYRRAAELEPSQPAHWGNLGDGLQALGRRTEARKAYAEAAVRARERIAATPLSPEGHMDVGYYCAKARQAGCALAEGARAAELQPGNVAILFRNSVIHSILGRQDEALTWLDRAVQLGLTRAEIENEPDLAPLRQQPRYRKLVELAK